MHLELGPVPADDVQQWARTARRLACELRADPADLEGVVTADFLDLWLPMVDTWSNEAIVSDGPFRWSGDIDVDRAAYLVHGLTRCIRSPHLQGLMSAETEARAEPFTMHVVQGLIDALSAEDHCQEHLCDQVRATLGNRLDH